MLFRFEPCRTCPSSAHLDLDRSLAPHDPDRPAGVVRGQPLEEGRALPPVANERRAPGEVSQLDLPLSGYEARALRQLNPDFDGPGELLVGGYACYVRRQVTGVLDDQLDTTEPLGEFLCLQSGPQARGRGCMGEGETGQLLALRSEEFGRRILDRELGLPAPQLHASELGVVEGAPGDEAITSELPVVPGEHLQRRLFGRVAEELDKVLHLDTGGPRHGPELDRESEDTVGIVSPIVEGAGYGLLRVVAEIVVDGDVRVACDLCAPLTERLENSEVVLGHLVVGSVGVRPQDRTTERMVGVHAEDVLVPEQEIDLRPRLRLRERVWPGALLLVLGLPVIRILTVHVEAVEGTRYPPPEAVVVLEGSFPVEPVVGGLGVGLVGGPGDHEPRVFVGDAPLAASVDDAHLEDVAVTVYILGVETRLLFGLGPGSQGRPQGVGRRQVALGAVGGETGEHIEGLFVEEAFDQVERRHRARNLAGVGVAVYPEGGLRLGRACLCVGKLREPDLTPLIALAYGLDLAEPGVLFRERVQNPCELLVA